MIGTYYRLSLADEDVGADKAESNSIQGQRGLVEGYIMARPELATEPRQEWVRRMRNLENRAEEIVKAELIYTFEGR